MLKLIGTPNINFVRSRRLWMAVSATVILLGILGILFQGGLNWSIDFTGGISAVIRPTPPPGQPNISEEEMRQALETVGVVGAEVKTSRSIEGEDIIIRMKYQGRFRPPEALIRAGLDQKLGGRWQIVPDAQLNPIVLEPFKNKSYVAVKGEVDEEEVKKVLQDLDLDEPLVVTATTLTGDSVLIAGGEGRDPISRLVKVLRQRWEGYQFDLRSVELVGPRIGAELRWKAIMAVIVSWFLIIVYLWWRFDLVFGIAAVVALIHDVLIALGIVNALGYEISMTVIGAFLTLIGFSVNDTIVVFDRIRENIRRYHNWGIKEIINASINQTLSRTIITSGTVFIVVLVLFFRGGEVLKGFALTMLVGSIVGTYSSIYIASPLLVEYVERTGKPLAQRLRKKKVG